MVSWRSKRQFIYLSGTLFFLLIFLGIPSYFYFQQKPSCFDGIQNQGETGIDCGGPCNIICQFEVASPILHWDRSFKMRDGVWSAAAYIQNPNNAYVENMPYRFRLLDSDGVLIVEKEGVAFIPPQQFFIIFEPFINVGDRIPTQEFFEFTSLDVEWIRSRSSSSILDIRNVSVVERTGLTRVSATLYNPSVSSINNIQVAGVVYDVEENVVGVSETYLERVVGGGEEDIVFTWPNGISESISRTEIVYTVLER